MVVLGPKQKKMVGARDEVTNMWEKLCLLHFSLVFLALFYGTFFLIILVTREALV
jgi:hypothetical protein